MYSVELSSSPIVSSGQSPATRWQRGQREMNQTKQRAMRSPDPADGWPQELSPPEDESHAGSCLRYGSFVVGLALATSAVLFVPVAVLHQRNYCQGACFSLDEDLRRSMNLSVHPCDDFYGHVCSGWDNKKSSYLAPLDKYSIAFSRKSIKGILLGKIPRYSSKAKDKAAGFIFRCLSRPDGHGEEKLVSFLKELDLPWPTASEATRPQLLDILVRASLKLGTPMFWAFYVGRHPSKPSENTIYMALEPRFIEWIHDIDTLMARNRVGDYLRRCAEIIGGEGQSYSVMIRHVLDAHLDIADLVHALWSENDIPQFVNLNDADLRRAVNGYLPDESQLWPADEIVNLQPELFAQLNATHLSQKGLQEGFKLFLGAYVVWKLSPLVSRYLTRAMLEDMGRGSSEENYRLSKCSEALEAVMPMVKWQLSLDAQDNQDVVWDMMRMAIRAVRAWSRSYGEATEKQAYSYIAGIGVGAFNMTSTWEMLNNAFGYLPNKTGASFFNAYLKAAKATVLFFKQSLHRPDHSIYHVPGICMIKLYRLLVAREIILEPYLTSWPLYEPWYPKAIPAAIAGTVLVGQMFKLLWFSFYHDSHFEVHDLRDVDQGAASALKDVRKFSKVVSDSGALPNATLREALQVSAVGISVHTASYLLNMTDWHSGPASSDGALGTNEYHPFQGFPSEQLFFLLTCFSRCGTTGRTRLRMASVCNLALPSSLHFRRAFKCGPEHRLFTNFTWKEFIESSSTTAVSWKAK